MIGLDSDTEKTLKRWFAAPLHSASSGPCGAVEEAAAGAPGAAGAAGAALARGFKQPTQPDEDQMQL